MDLTAQLKMMIKDPDFKPIPQKKRKAKGSAYAELKKLVESRAPEAKTFRQPTHLKVITFWVNHRCRGCQQNYPAPKFSATSTFLCTQLPGKKGWEYTPMFSPSAYPHLPREIIEEESPILACPNCLASAPQAAKQIPLVFNGDSSTLTPPMGSATISFETAKPVTPMTWSEFQAQISAILNLRPLDLADLLTKEGIDSLIEEQDKEDELSFFTTPAPLTP